MSGRQRGRRQKNKTPVDGSHSTSDRVNICSSTVNLALRASSAWPPGFTLASGLDLRPKAPVFSPRHRVQSPALSES